MWPQIGMDTTARSTATGFVFLCFLTRDRSSTECPSIFFLLPRLTCASEVLGQTDRVKPTDQSTTYFVPHRLNKFNSSIEYSMSSKAAAWVKK